MIQNKRKIVLEQIITTIASVADTAEEGFGAYYDGLVVNSSEHFIYSDYCNQMYRLN